MTNEEAIELVRVEMGKVAAGMMDALSLLAVLIYCGGKLSKGEFVDIASKAADLFGRSGDDYCAPLLRGVVERLKSFEGEIPTPRQTQ